MSTFASVSEATHILKVQRENHRRNVKLRMQGTPAPRSWEAFVERRIGECKKYLADERARDKECAGKVQYPSLAAADADLARLRSSKTGLRNGSRVASYVCRFCSRVHVGNTTNLKRKAA